MYRAGSYFEMVEPFDQNGWVVEHVSESCGISRSEKSQTEMYRMIYGS
jgi:hypothetical protein